MRVFTAPGRNACQPRTLRPAKPSSGGEGAAQTPRERGRGRRDQQTGLPCAECSGVPAGEGDRRDGRKAARREDDSARQHVAHCERQGRDSGR